MKKSRLSYYLIMLLVVGMVIGFGFTSPDEPDTESNASTTLSQEVLSVEDAPFDIMMQVIAHKRCVNCHPSGDRPHQGEESHLHRFGVQRGEDGHGTAALQCGTCHQEENNNFSGVPGAPHWHLAPRSMGWEGLTKVEIAQAMVDRSKNGGRSIQEIEKHLTEDPLVLWVFEPGVNQEGIPREKPPVSKEAYVSAVKAWVAAGAPIPSN